MIVDGINEWIREGRGLVVGPNPFKKREIPEQQAEGYKVVLDGEEQPPVRTNTTINVISSVAVDKPIKKKKLIVFTQIYL
jgi:hypothetical protein